MADTSGAGQAAGGEGELALTAADVAAAVGGRLVGDPSARVNGLAPLDRAGPSHVSFLASERYVAQFAASRAGVVLVSPGFAEAAGPATRVVVDKPHEALLALIPRFHAPPPRVPGIHPTAQLGRGVTLGDEVTIGPFVAIGNGATIGDRAVIGSHCSIGDGARVGDESVLHPGVVLYANSRVGNRVILHSGVRVGSDGFGYVQQGGRHVKIPHVGGCVIEDDVEIGANSTIDRGSIGDTIVGAGTKIDNLVHLGHNVRIGRLCLIMAQVGISGSTHVEDGCVVAGQAGLAGHTTIGAGARIGAQAGVFGSVPPGATWSGYPARPHREALRAQAALFKLPKLLRRLEQLGEGETR